MAHLREKYDKTYFLGGVDPETGTPYGVLGHQEFAGGGINERLKHEADVAIAFVGTLAGKRVLDVGMGRGDRIPLLLQQGVAAYAGFDVSADAVQIARERFSDPRVSIALGEATALEARGEYDLVLLFDVIEHIPVFEMEAVWPLLHRALTPGGCLFLSTPLFPGPNVADHTDANPSVSGIHCNKQTHGTLLRSFLRHGFTVACVEERIFGLVRTADLPALDAARRAAHLRTHAAALERAGALAGMPAAEILAAAVPPPGRIAVGCVADSHPKYLTQALRLLTSLRLCGGALAGANFFACFLELPAHDYVREFERLGAFIRVVPRVSERHPYSNKLGFFGLPELRHYDTLLLLDCDTAVVRDPLPFIDGRSLQCKIADLPTLPHESLARVFAHFGVPLPPREHRCTQDGTPTIMYCNSGVVALPARLLDTFVARWLRCNGALAERLDLLGSLQTFCDQASLSLAFAQEPTPFAPLPLEMNFPVHLADAATPAGMDEADPAIVHYHDRVDASGYLLPVPYPAANRRIEALNLLLRQRRSQGFDNRTFWDFRYSFAPELGSGLGSRGEALAYKRGLLLTLYERARPATVLDVGCGDGQLTEGLPAAGYTGVDISPVAVEQVRRRLPGRAFVAGDFLALPLAPADLVICFDLLIHQPDGAVYRQLVRTLVERTAGIGIVSGYEEDPLAGPGIVYFHEPLSATLRAAGARNLLRVGRYRSVTIWQYEGAAGEEAAAISRPVFVLGAMRSGTTLLADLLGRAPGLIHCPFELKEVWAQAGGVAMASARTRNAGCFELGAADAFCGQRERLSAAFAARMRANAAGKRPDAVLLNKNPHLCNKVPLVDALFPDARFLWIRRPLPQVVVSLRELFADVNRRQQTWHCWPLPGTAGRNRCWQALFAPAALAGWDPARVFPGGDVTFLAEYWFESNRAIAEALARLPASRWHQVDEEELLRDPGGTLRRCLRFLGEDADEELPIDRTLDPGRNERWRSLVTGQERRAIEAFSAAHGI
jgi:2-polyprenyl-3-methyl-5-hydroxy-6-metoxy-1,4-benzoquinol methylase